MAEALILWSELLGPMQRLGQDVMKDVPGADAEEVRTAALERWKQKWPERHPFAVRVTGAPQVDWVDEQREPARA